MGIDFPNSPSAGDTYTYEGETYRYNGVAFVKVRDRVTTFNGATGAIVGVSSVNGLTGSVTLKPSGFEYEIISTTLSVINDTIPSSGGIRILRDYIGSTSIVFNRFDKQDNDLAFPQINLQNNGGTIIGISEDGEKFFHIVSPDSDARTGHSFTIQSNTVTPGKLKFQDTTNIPNDGSPDTGLIAMDNFSVGDKIFVQFIPNIAPTTTVGGVSGPIVLASTLELGGPSGATLDINVDNLAVVHSFNGATGAIIGVTSVQGKTGDVTLTDLEITHGVETFNGLSGSIDTTSLTLPVTGLSASGGITLSGNLSIAGDIITQDNIINLKTTGGELMLRFTGSETIINNSAVDQDFRIKGNGDDQLLFTNAGNNKVGIGTTTPTEKLDVNGIIKASGITLAGGITFADGTQQKTATKDVGTFTISASSAISTGAKADALHRIPYNATLTKFELKSKATGGMTAAVYIAGGDFGNPTTGFVTGATAETTGLTGETTTFGTASVNEGDFVYLHVLANASGATAAQAFVSYETR
mgnify:CR=1 FL=1